jgi:hypothetical protein
LRWPTCIRDWQRRHGFQINCYDPRLHAPLRKLKSPDIDRVRDITYEAKPPYEAGRTAPQQVAANFATIETCSTQLLATMRAAEKKM